MHAGRLHDSHLRDGWNDHTGSHPDGTTAYSLHHHATYLIEPQGQGVLTLLWVLDVSDRSAGVQP